MSNQKSATGGLALVLAVVALITPAEAASVMVDPIPINDLVAIFGIGGYYSFDPETHIFVASDPIVAVQFPNQVLSFDDPVVNGLVIVSGTFSGAAVDPLSKLDTSGMFSGLTTSIYIGGQLAYSEFAGTEKFSAIYPGPNTTVADWEGAPAVVTFIDASLVASSPFLSLYVNFHDTSVPDTDTGWVYGTLPDMSQGHIGTVPTKKGALSVPEPATTYETGVALVMLIGYAAIRRVRLGARVAAMADTNG
jgi:hypothetical protein